MEIRVMNSYMCPVNECIGMNSYMNSYSQQLSLTQTLRQSFPKFTPLPRRFYLSLPSPHTQSRILEANPRSPRASRAVGAVLLAAWGPRLRHVGAAGRDGENRRLLPLQPHSMLLNIVLQTRDILVRDNQN